MSSSKLQLLCLALLTGLLACNTKTETKSTKEDSEITASSIQKSELEKTTNQPKIIITPNGLPDYTIGDSIDPGSEFIERSEKRSGEGVFAVYNLKATNGEQIGVIYPDQSNHIRTIEILSSNLETKEGVKAGNSFEDLRKVYPDLVVVGSEIESRVSAIANDIVFVLDTHMNISQVDLKNINPKTKVKQILIKGQFKSKEIEEPKNYLCFKSDGNTSPDLMLGLRNDTLAVSVQYKNQNSPIRLIKTNSKYLKGKNHPTTIDFYDEIYQNRLNGKYELKKSGNWYYLNYKRGKDQKEFNYTIDHTANNFSSQPCFLL